MEISEIISSGLLELYVAGLESEEESRLVEQWIAQYPAVKEELKAIELALENYATDNAIAPAEGVKQRLMAQIAVESDEQHHINQAPYTTVSPTTKVPVIAMWKRLAAASVVLLAGSVIFGLVLFNKQKTTEKELAIAKNQINLSQTVLQKLQQAHLDAHHDMEALLSGGFVRVNLQKTGNAPEGCTAAIYWNKKTGEMYIDPCRMSKAPDGKTYQLWAIVQGKPVDAGMVKTATAEEKYSIQKMKVFQQAEGFTITLEKDGGSPIPTPGQEYVTGRVA